MSSEVMVTAGKDRAIPSIPLDGLINIQSGYAFKSEDYTPTGHFLVRIGNVQNGEIRLDNAKYVTLDRRTKPFELTEGDILTSLTGNIGRVARIESAHLPAALNQRVARIIVKDKGRLDDAYLYYALSSPNFRDRLAFDGGGAAQQNVSPKAIAGISIPLPPLNEQRRIVEVLRSVDAAIAAAEDVALQAGEAFEAILADLFARYGDASVKLESYCVSGGLQTGPFGSQLKAEDYVEEGVPIIMPVDLMPEGMDFMGAKKAPTGRVRELAHHILQPGDVLFARRGEIGRCGLYLESDPVALCGTGCLRARLNTKKIDPALAYFLIQSRQARDWLCAHAVGATMPNLNTTIIGDLPMPDIPQHEQAAWVDALLMLEGTRRINQLVLLSHETTKTAIMSALLSGDVRVPE